MYRKYKKKSKVVYRMLCEEYNRVKSVISNIYVGRFKKAKCTLYKAFPTHFSNVTDRVFVTPCQRFIV